jgi:enamine deaminase RidA (YjgF/YER057c/UK114 family)
MSADKRSKLAPERFTPVGGCYSHGLCVEVGDARLVFVTGQLAIDADSNVVGRDDPRVQAAFVLDNVVRILSEAGLGLEDVVKGQLFLAPPARMQDVQSEIDAALSEHGPAFTVVGVSALARDGCSVELEVVACAPRHHFAI